MRVELLYLLSKARHGLRPNEEFEEACAELVDSGLLRNSRTWIGRPILRLTDTGRQELLKAQHSTNRVARAVASGLFDHLPFGLCEQIVNSPEADRYIESQQQVQRLIFFSQLFPR